MEMILVDWTRMGRTYCIAGLVSEGQGWRTVRPMPVASRGGSGRPRLWGVVDALLSDPPKPGPSQPPANVGWSEPLALQAVKSTDRGGRGGDFARR